MTEPVSPRTFNRTDLHGIALLALQLAHGTDAELDPREIDTIADRLLVLESTLSGDDVIVVFREAAKMYALKEVDAEDIIIDLAHSLEGSLRERAFALLRAVAEADGVIVPGESRLLRKVAEGWNIGPAFVRSGETAG
jgi:uncharacterized tellurite resistance protein B-like protein